MIYPIAEQFRPDIVLVSAGFDAMKDDPLGMLSNSPAIYAYMTHRLMQLT
jgi:histone deacetylase 6